jgi:diguanylate cyclase (GGDEF)-like protein
MRKLITTLARPTITTGRDLVRYVLLVTAMSLVVALVIDVTNQLVFFTEWSAAFRSWAVTIFAVLVIAMPASLVFGRAQRELQQSQRELETLSRTDSLTGLPNRRALMEASEVSVAQTMVLVIADVDRFKFVNDTYGHRTGDVVLQTIGRIMASHLTKFGLVGRLGGEEFALISSTAPVDEIVAALDELIVTIAKTSIIVPDGAVTVTMSIGVALRHPNESFDRLYSEADEALYLAKRGGRNRIELSARMRDSRQGHRAPAARS